MTNQTPDWPPKGSAIGLPDGTQQRGSTGQLFEVRNGQWVRVQITEDGELPKVNQVLG